MSVPPSHLSAPGPAEKLEWTDEDGARIMFTTDNETCGEGDALCVVAVLDDAQTGGVYMQPEDARQLIGFLQAALWAVAA